MDGVFSAIKMMGRIILLLIFSSLLTLTTKPLDIALALETLLSPLKKIGLPIQDFSIMLSITLRFIPTILQEFNTIGEVILKLGIPLKNCLNIA